MTYDEIDENKRMALGFAKSIVMASARSKGWNGEHKGIHIYQTDIYQNTFSCRCNKCSKVP